MSNADDAQLLERARSGDRRALEDLLTKLEPSVLKFGLKICGDPESAQEVLQETLFSALRYLADFRGDAAISTWLYMVAKSVCIKQRRKSKFAPASVEPLEAASEALFSVTGGVSERPDELVERAELGERLRRAIAALEPAYREVLVLRDVEGLSAAEVAETLDLSVEAVKTRLHRARRRVREVMDPTAGNDAPTAASACPDIDSLLSARLEGDTTAETCRELEQHLAGCPRCKARCDSLRKVLRKCQLAGDSGSLEPAVRASVQQAVRDFLAHR